MLVALTTGAQTLVQDRGRPGHRHKGIPSSGAADGLNYALANWIVGNAPDEAVLECALGGLTLRATADHWIAVTGATCPVHINDRAVKPFQGHLLKKGQTLSLGQTTAGVRTYVAIAGGVDADMFLSSASSYPPAHIGAFGGRPIKATDRIAIHPIEDVSPRTLPAAYRPTLSNHVVLRARSSIEFEALSPTSQRELFIHPFTASTATDRMGARLDGVKLGLAAPLSMTSSPLLPGTLQVPPDGVPILSLVDGHCTGGYARALHIIRADQWLLGQIGPGTRVSFQRCLSLDAPKILHARIVLYQSLIPEFSV